MPDWTHSVFFFFVFVYQLCHLSLVVPLLSLAIPSLSLAIPGPSLLVPSQSHDVPGKSYPHTLSSLIHAISIFFFKTNKQTNSLLLYDSFCLMFYEQYINSYSKQNLLRTIIKFIFQKNFWSKWNSCSCVNNVRKVINTNKKKLPWSVKCRLPLKQIGTLKRIMALKNIKHRIQSHHQKKFKPWRKGLFKI